MGGWHANHSDALACACGARTIVVDSRGHPGLRMIRRRRECTACRERITTYESAEHPTLAAERAEAARARIVGLIGALRRELEALTEETTDAPV